MNITTSSAAKPFFTQALEALKLGDRRRAAALLGRELREGNTAQKNLPSVAQLAVHIGEIELAIEASRRWAPNSVNRCSATGRCSEATVALKKLLKTSGGSRSL